MLTSFVERLIRVIKNDSNYSIKYGLSTQDIVVTLIRRGLALLRGWLYLIIRFRKISIFFKGKNSNIYFSNHMEFGSPLTIGDNVTIECLGKTGIKLGSNVNIPDGCFIRCTGVISELGIGIEIGDNTGLGHNIFINSQGGVSIGDDVIIGPNVSILAENHVFTSSEELIRLQGVNRIGIKIKNNVWIGANVTILDGVEIGTGCVIGAGSVVTKSIPSYSIAVGNPCKVVKSRLS